MNLCTDQLALLLAEPGQLISVSHLALDPLSSPMVAEAAAYPVNHGLAEEIFLMRPDLVLTQPYTKPATVALLRQLGIRVEMVPSANNLQDVREALRVTGALLGQEAQAEAQIVAFDAALARLPELSGDAPRAAIYHANGYTTGPRTLAGDILKAAGLANLATELGLDWGGTLPLEQLILARPDLVITGQSYPGSSRAEEILRHPALQVLRNSAASASSTDADWVCGTPHVLRAVSDMAALRHSLSLGRTDP